MTRATAVAGKRHVRFLCDTMCGRLARYLRMCGYDTVYALDRGIESDEAVAALSRAEGRTVITRDGELAGIVEDAILLTERDILAQLRALRDRGIELTIAMEPTYCGRCNGTLVPVPSDRSLPDYVPDAIDTKVLQCERCGQHFWRGSHWDDVRKTLSSL